MEMGYSSRRDWMRPYCLLSFSNMHKSYPQHRCAGLLGSMLYEGQCLLFFILVSFGKEVLDRNVFNKWVTGLECWRVNVFTWELVQGCNFSCPIRKIGSPWVCDSLESFSSLILPAVSIQNALYRRRIERNWWKQWAMSHSSSFQRAN